LIIKNAKIFDENRGFIVGDINIESDKITKQQSSDQEIDATNLYAVPGLIDLHFHGCNGFDFCDGTHEAFNEISNFEAKNGVTTICPATMTLEEKELERIISSFATFKEGENGANICGIYMEGPYISKNKKGAQNSTFITLPDVEIFNRMQKLSGNKVKAVTVAPEVDGAMEFIEKLKDDVVISIAHTEANYEQTKKAIEMGASQITHLYNAMPPFHHREPGVIGAAADSPNCFVELICDGIHIHPSVIRATLKMFGENQVIMISDSMMAAGLSDGIYSLGKQEVKVEGKLAYLTADGAIAGSVTNLMGCVRFIVKNVGIPLEKAIKFASTNPAKTLGIFDQYGSLEAGKVANILLLDEDLNIKHIILRGKISV